MTAGSSTPQTTMGGSSHRALSVVTLSLPSPLLKTRMAKNSSYKIQYPEKELLSGPKLSVNCFWSSIYLYFPLFHKENKTQMALENSPKKVVRDP